MAHMGAYSPDEMNGLHWQWHQRAALRICATMQEHNIFHIPGSPGYQGHASGPTGHAGQGDSVGPPHPRARAHSMWLANPNSPPSGRAVQGGGAPDHRRPSQRWKAPPRERPSATPTASNAGPQGRTLWGRCWVPATAPTAPGTHGSRNPEDGRPGEGQRLTPGAPHNRGRPAPLGQPPTTPTARSPHRACRPRGQCWAPTPTHPCPQHVGGRPQQPAQWAGSRGGGGT